MLGLLAVRTVVDTHALKTPIFKVTVGAFAPVQPVIPPTGSLERLVGFVPYVPPDVMTIERWKLLPRSERQFKVGHNGSCKCLRCEGESLP